MANKKFAEQIYFREACEKVGLPREKHAKLGLGRQAGKWRRAQGLAYKEGR